MQCHLPSWDVKGGERGDAVPILAVTHLRRMKGRSQPQLIRCVDGNYYVVKFQNNPQGGRILANEMLATKLALALGLPTAETAVVEVSERLLEQSPEMYLERSGRRYGCAPGLHFGSRFVCDPLLTPVFDFLPDVYLERAVNRESFLGMLVFDMWTSNSDSRQVVFHLPGTSVLRPPRRGPSGRYKATMIDQGCCFNGNYWSFSDEPWQGIYSRPCVYAEVRSLDTLAAFVERLRDLDEDVLWEAADSVPPEWYGRKKDELAGLLRGLVQRRMVIGRTILNRWSRIVRSAPVGDMESSHPAPRSAVGPLCTPQRACH